MASLTEILEPIFSVEEAKLTKVELAKTLLKSAYCAVRSKRIAPAVVSSGQFEHRTTFPRSGSEIQKAMADQTIKTLGDSNLLRHLMYNLVQAAIELQSAIAQKGNIHVFLSCASTESANAARDQNLYPVVSNLYHSALMASNSGSTVVAQAIRDAFLLARRVADGRYNEQQRILRAGVVPKIELPTWFPYSVPEHPTAEESNPVYVTCDHNIMKQLEKVGSKTVTDIYGQLITDLWNKGRDKKVVSGRITYARMTPPWMAKPVVFVHGSNQNSSTAFNLLKLSTKSEIRDPSNRKLAMAIIATFFKLEKPLSLYLAYILRKNCIELPAQHHYQSTVDLTGTKDTERILDMSHDERDSFMDDTMSINIAGMNLDNNYPVCGTTTKLITQVPTSTSIVRAASSNMGSVNPNLVRDGTPNRSTPNTQVANDLNGSDFHNTPMHASSFFAQHFPVPTSSTNAQGTLFNQTAPSSQSNSEHS